mgnify:CR=1 FL=1
MYYAPNHSGYYQNIHSSNMAAYIECTQQTGNQ